MLERGPDIYTEVCSLLRSSLAFEYIPRARRNIRIALIPNPGKIYKERQSLKPISVLFFVLKTLEKLLGRYIRDGILV